MRTPVRGDRRSRTPSGPGSVCGGAGAVDGCDYRPTHAVYRRRQAQLASEHAGRCRKHRNLESVKGFIDTYLTNEGTEMRVAAGARERGTGGRGARNGRRAICTAIAAVALSGVPDEGLRAGRGNGDAH